MTSRLTRTLSLLLLAFAFDRHAAALSSGKAFSQYSITVWNQQQGIPEDTITAITQTPDGYLWIGTDEGLARFDGYDFVVYNNAKGDLPSNTVKALTVGQDGSLWVGTSDGLVHFAGGKTQTFTVRNGLPKNSIADLTVDRTGTLWIAGGGVLTRFDGKAFAPYPGKEIPMTVTTVYQDFRGTLWIGGLGGVAGLVDGKFSLAVRPEDLDGDVVTRIIVDPQDNLWVAGSLGIIRRSPDGKIRKFTRKNGLPDNFVRTLSLDREENLWAGTSSGLARLNHDRFEAEGPAHLIRCLFEDREHDLWLGAGDGLSRLRDVEFSVFGMSEGFPGDHPNTAFEDRKGVLWIGFHDRGVLAMQPGGYREYRTRDGLPSEEVFSIRQTRAGEMLFSTRGGLVRMAGGKFRTYVSPDDFRRRQVFDALEDGAGRIWLGLPNGLARLENETFRWVIAGEPGGISSVVTLYEARDGALWAGTYYQGIWRIQGDDKRHFTTEQGLSSNNIRAFVQDRDGTMWIATYGGGLNAWRDGRFTHFSVRDGLLSDNISSIVDDGNALWLATTQGICRIEKTQLRQFIDRKIARLRPVKYGLDDGLRSTQAAPGSPVAGGGTQTSDGRLWFPTGNGLAVIDPHKSVPPSPPPVVHIESLTVDGRPADLVNDLRLPARTGRLQIRYAAIHLSAPQRVTYSYKLEGVDPEWVQAGQQREIDYNSLASGKYIFRVKAELESGAPGEITYTFQKLPKFYETLLFRFCIVLAIIAVAWVSYRVHLRQIRYRFSVVLEDRARISRDIHDTLAQGFVGISSQLEAVATALPNDVTAATRYLDLARRMARHSMTEARRAISDLRLPLLESGDLGTALRSGAEMWTLGSDVEVEIQIPDSRLGNELSEELQQQILRITQEAVTNAIKHASASRILVTLHQAAGMVYLQVVDDGKGFQKPETLSSLAGHFGLIGMQERAARVRGEFRLETRPGRGTEIHVKAPLS